MPSAGRIHRLTIVLLLAAVLTLGAFPGTAGPLLPVAHAQTGGAARDGGDSQNVVGGIGGDPLRRNGLISPSCRSGSALTAQQAANCRASGSPASRVPITHYQFDIHINTSLVGLGAADAMMVIQQIIIQPIWILLLWLTHGVTVILGWCFELNLFDRQTMGPIAEALEDGRRLFTKPWLQLTLVLMVAPLLYHGVLQRRAGKGISQLLLTIVMLTVGFWIIANPFASVGWLANGVQKVSLSTVAAFSSGRVTQPEIDFNRALQNVFATAIQKPYAYMEFGDVDWATNPRRRDRRLFTQESIENAVAMNLGSTFDDMCTGSIVDCARSLRDREFLARLKSTMHPMIEQARTAPTNADLFLTFPANGMARNSINDDKSLYKTLCQPKGGEKDCTGTTRHEANFRKQGQTFARLAGLGLIGVGLAGFSFLLGFLAYRLLKAALFALFYLLCTPVAVVLAPLGDVGLRHFKTWGVRLLGSIIAKLIFAVFLGVVFLVVNVLSKMGSLGFWTQWFLIAAFYWMVWVHRDEVLSFLHIGHEEMGRRGASAIGELFAARMGARAIGDVARSGGRAVRGAGDATRRAAVTARTAASNRSAARTLAAGERTQASFAATTAAAREDRSQQTDQTLTSDLAAHRQQAEPITRLRTLADQLQAERAEAMQQGDYSRASDLHTRWSGVEQTLAARRTAFPLSAASDRIVQDADERQARTGSPIDERTREDRARWLDQQAQTPARAGAAAEIANGTARDYSRLAALADPEMTADRFEQLPAPQQAQLRRQVDAQLTRRQAGLALAAAGRAPLPREVAGFVAAYHRAAAQPSGRAATAAGTSGAGGEGGEGRAGEQLQRERIRRQFGVLDREMQDRWRDRHVARRRRDRPPTRAR